MTQGSIGTSGYIQMDSVKAYQKDYYERNKEKIKKQRKRREEARRRYMVFKKQQDDVGTH